MKSVPLTQFKLINRNKSSTLVMLPGWATDAMIFSDLDLNYNYLLPTSYFPETVEAGLLEAIQQNNLNQVSILGWSMGGFLAAEFTRHNAPLIDHLILVSIRQQYPKNNIDLIRQSLKSRLKGFLHSFYTQCCSGKGDWEHFKIKYLAGYVNQMRLEDLLSGLDYLERTPFPMEALKDVKNITFIHGVSDRIAPLAEVRRIQEQVPKSKLVCLNDSGHIPFFAQDFRKHVL